MLLSVFIGNDESLRSGSVGSARPEEGVGTVAIVAEGCQEKGVFVDGVDFTVDFMVVGIEFSDVFAFVRTFVVFLT